MVLVGGALNGAAKQIKRKGGRVELGIIHRAHADSLRLHKAETSE
jgi:hypothetical protein